MAEINDFTPKGKKTFYWPNGNKRLEGEWVDGLKTGEFKYYNEDGTLNQTITYNNNIPNGVAKRVLNDKTVMEYEYTDGTLMRSNEYINNVLIGTYGYSDALIYPDPDAPDPPPIGTLYHAFNGKHPGEIFKGTLWTYIENSFHVDNNGNQVPVDVWLREGSVGKGPYIYDGPFIEYRVSDGSVLRKGSYIRKIVPDQASTSLLNGDEYLYRENGSPMYHSVWRSGVKVSKVEYYDSKSRIWKAVTLGSDSKYVDGFYDIFDLGVPRKIYYDYDNKSQVAQLRFQK